MVGGSGSPATSSNQPTIGGVVGRGVGEGRAGELPLGRVGEHAAGLQLVDHLLVLRRVGEDADVA